MRKMYHLGTCTTCQAIIKDTGISETKIKMQDIKTAPVTEAQLDEMKDLAGSYEALFSRRAMLYKERGLKDAKLGEPDFRDLILEHYTFLKRPVTILGKKIFIGNEKKAVSALKEAVSKI
jgi:arsenate reductase